MTFLLKPASGNDVDFLLELRLATMDTHLREMGVCFSREQHRERVLLEFEHARLIIVDGAVVGMVKFLRMDNTLRLQQLQVLPEWQGKGIGRQVVDHLVSLADSQALPVTLSVLKRNPALRLYKRQGFVQVGEDDHEFRLKREAGGCESAS